MMPFKKLNVGEHDSTDKLIHAIESKDRRFRLFQMLFMVGTFVALIIIISAQQRTLDGVQTQLTQAKEVAQEQNKQSDELGKRIERRLDCMVVFFSQQERANLSIANIDKCTLNRDGDIQRFFRDDPDRGTVTTPTEQPSNLAPSPAVPSQGTTPTDPVDDGDDIIEPRPPLTLNIPLIDLSPVCALQILCVR